ncbi:MAG: hypothetical protein HUU15_07165 [Candidatus Brocadiae bacterium]|nr:hypothetical protein [Candidatus Brocadiia bacterium]
MTCRLLSTAALLIACTLVARAEEKTWDLSLKTKAKVGQKYAIASREAQTMKMKILMGEEVVQEQETSSTLQFEGTAEVLEVKDGDAVKLKAVFGKALNEQSGGEEEGETTYGFEGKTVIATKNGKAWSYAYEDGGAVEEGDVEGLQKGLHHSRDEEKKPFEEVCAPKAPVAIGGTWSPDLVELIAGFTDDGKLSMDAEESKATFKLLSVTARDGVEVSKVEGKMSLAATAFGPLELDEPIMFEVTMGLESDVDGSRPDGKMEAAMIVKGTRTATLQNGQELTLDIDMTMKSSESRVTVK